MPKKVNVVDELAKLGGDIEEMRRQRAERAMIDCILTFARRGRQIREDLRQARPDETGPEMEEADYAS